MNQTNLNITQKSFHFCCCVQMKTEKRGENEEHQNAICQWSFLHENSLIYVRFGDCYLFNISFCPFMVKTHSISLGDINPITYIFLLLKSKLLPKINAQRNVMSIMRKKSVFDLICIEVTNKISSYDLWSFSF